MRWTSILAVVLTFGGIYALYRFLWAALERWLPASPKEEEE
jgi:hypothetical protein